MKKIVGIFIVTLLITIAVLPVVGTMNQVSDNNIFSSNNSEIQWSKTYGGEEADNFRDVKETDDGGYIACGGTEESNNHHPWVLKVDSDGNELWDWSITEFTVDSEVLVISNCYVNYIIQTSDGSYFISLSMLETTNNDETYRFGGIAKLNSEGGEEWVNILGDGFEWNIQTEEIIEVEEGILGVGAYTNPLDPGYGIGKSGCLFKVNNNGELEWYKKFNFGEFVDKLFGFCGTNDGGFLLSGCVGIVEDTYWDGWLIKTDSQGEKEWEKIFSGPKNDVLAGCIQIDNGDYLIGGWTSSFGFGKLDVWALKTDGNGNEIWNKTFGEGGYDFASSGDTIDDGFLMSAVINDGGITTDSWVIKMDIDGNAEWKHIFDVETKQYFLGICSTSDGGCIASGVLGTYNHRNSDALLVKYAPMENQRPTKPTINGPKNGQTYVEYVFKASSTDPDGDSILYMWDWGDGNYSDWLDINEVSYTWTTENNYKIRVITSDEHGGESEWSDPFKFSTPKNKLCILFSPIINRYIQRFPILKLLL